MLSAASFQVAAGDRIGLVGRNGAGKTTLTRILAGESLPAAGTVSGTSWSSAYGWRVFVEHAGGLVTSYNHLPGVDVSVGAELPAGGQVGRVGNTGLSTGCHLHWMAWRDGELIDPLTLIET